MPAMTASWRLMETATEPAPAPSEAGNSPAEELPGLYRKILDQVAKLEELGARTEAGRIRQSATEVYSRSWDLAGRKKLMGLIARADRTIVGEQPSRAWVLRRRSVPAR
jgi:hypothetical protein